MSKCPVSSSTSRRNCAAVDQDHTSRISNVFTHKQLRSMSTLCHRKKLVCRKETDNKYSCPITPCCPRTVYCAAGALCNDLSAIRQPTGDPPAFSAWLLCSFAAGAPREGAESFRSRQPAVSVWEPTRLSTSNRLHRQKTDPEHFFFCSWWILFYFI